MITRSQLYALCIIAVAISCTEESETIPPESSTCDPNSPAAITPQIPAKGYSLTPGVQCRPNAPPPGVFEDAAVSLGITFRHNYTVSDPEGALEVDAAGAATADLNGDGLLDMYFTNAGGADTFYLSDDKQPLSYRVFTHNPKMATTSVTTADLNGDGIRDIVLTTIDEVFWLTNNGAGQFGEPRPLIQSLIEDEAAHAPFGATVGDVNGDGLLDVYVANHETEFSQDEPGWPGAEWLMLNTCGGFEEITSSIPKTRVEDKTFLVSLIDLDNDGDLDLYETNDQWSLAALGIDPKDTEKQGNRLFRNDGLDVNGSLQLTNVSEGSGADVAISGMGAAVGDYDNDGLIDLYITAMLPEANALLHNQGQLKFTDTTTAMNAHTLTEEHDVGWGAVFFDADMDGWLDLFVTHGYNTGFVSSPNPDRQSDILLRNVNGKSFEDITSTAGVGGTSWGRSPAVADLNRDGFPDLVVGNANDAPYIYLNGCDDRPWLTVKLHGPAANIDGVGAVITAQTETTTQTRPLLPGSDGLYGASAPEAYFGFPHQTQRVNVQIRWPNGTLQSIDDVPVSQMLTVWSK